MGQVTMAKGYRVGWGEGSTVAWKVLNFEYEDLGNEHILDDVSKFISVKGNWPTVLDAFKRQYGDAMGIWLTREKDDAVEYYGEHGGDLLECDFDPRQVISDIGPDGIFVLNPGECIEVEAPAQ